MQTLCFISHKGGVGKTTLAAALSVAAHERGLQVAVLDFDTPTLGLTRFATLRSKAGLWAPTLLSAPRLLSTRTPNSREAGFVIGQPVSTARASGVDLLIIDLEAVTNALWLKAAACLASDRVVTPVGDSPLDIQSVLGADGGELSDFIGSAGPRRPDWIIVRNRLGHLRTRLAAEMGERLDAHRVDCGYRLVSGLSDRVAYREMFLHGSSPLDPSLDPRPLTMSALAAKSEMRRLACDLLEAPSGFTLGGWARAANI